MATGHSTIEPFPGDIDRDHFGRWLSGFTDGEGSFVLAFYRNAVTRKGKTSEHDHASAYFRIKLRDDDTAILELIRSFWHCGRLAPVRKSTKVANAKPQISYTVTKIDDMARIIVPHFERYPLFAKKKRDFLIWKDAVELLATINRRPVRARRSTGNKRWQGTVAKWTDQERQHFVDLKDSLKNMRMYESTDTTSQCKCKRHEATEKQSFLFT